ncbi:DMT family transporter [Aquincola sp. MAHUQ-54]|uniref:DMT family transporter n=1 Tax=Aquincola agrisoli TaxID=3119538 RepID=A0AAW9QG22_9BURK
MQRPLQGIGFVVIAVACFAGLDTGTKMVSNVVPVVMAVWFRYLFQALVTALAMLPRRGLGMLRTRRPGLQFARGALLTASSAFSYLSLRHMPVGEFTAIVMLTPLIITLMAATSLGERITPLRWLCVGGGFVGALTVIRPGGEMFTVASLMPLGLVATNAAYQLLTSRLAKTEDAATMHFYTGCIGAGLATVLLPFAWTPLSAGVWTVLVLIGICSTLGHYLLILAYSRAPVAVLTPYLYLQIAFATLAGWIAFSHVPDGWSITGIAMIGVCGALGTWLTARDRRHATR